VLNKYVVKLAGRTFFVLAATKVAAYRVALDSYRRDVGDPKVSPLSESITAVA
jgi:hypothetical protein